MSRYASNQDVVRFFDAHGIQVSQVRREGALRHLSVEGKRLTLPMDASPDDCLHRVRESMAASETPAEVK